MVTEKEARREAPEAAVSTHNQGSLETIIREVKIG
jgi:hypothetical protein